MCEGPSDAESNSFVTKKRFRHIKNLGEPNRHKPHTHVFLGMCDRSEKVGPLGSSFNRRIKFNQLKLLNFFKTENHFYFICTPPPTAPVS